MREFCIFTLHRNDESSLLYSQEMVVLENPADRCKILQACSFSSYFNLMIMKSCSFCEGDSVGIFLAGTVSSSFISSLRFSPNTKRAVKNTQKVCHFTIHFGLPGLERFTFPLAASLPDTKVLCNRFFCDSR